MQKKEEQILYIGFNQKRQLITLGTEKGFRIFSTITLKEVGSREMGGGIGIVEVLQTSNIMALTGGGRYPLYSLSKVVIWDDDEKQKKAELTFKGVVKAVRLKIEYMVVLLENKVYVFSVLNNMDCVFES